MIKYKLKELLTIKNGKDHKDLPDGKIPVYGSGGLMRYVNEFLYDKESILLPRKGTLSNIQYVNTPFWSVDTLYYTVVDTKKVNAFYLYYLIKQFDLSKLNTGTGVPSMTFDSYYDLEVCIPDLAVQNEIADILKSLDSKIALNNRINAELEAMAKTVYDYWFVQFDFPNAEGKPYKSNGGKMVWSEELKREVPEGWEVKTLQELSYQIGDGLHGTPQYVDNSEYNFINGNNLKDGFIQTDESTNKVTQAEYEKYYIDLNSNSILLSINGTLGNLAIYTNEKVLLGKSSAYINCKENHRAFCYLFLKQNQIQKSFWNIATGSTIKNLSLASLKNLKLIYPGIEIVKCFEKLVKPMDDKRENIFKENQQLSSLRDWLLPMLMNGQVVSTTLNNLGKEVEVERLMAAEPGEEYGRKY